MTSPGGTAGNSGHGWSVRGYPTALQFLTILPVKVGTLDWASQRVRSLRWFPAVGATVGVVVGLAGLIFGYLFGVPMAAVLMVALEGVLTGGLHWDGLADSCDALFSGRPAEQKLIIMRDSRIGTFGAATLFVNLLVRITLFNGLLGTPTVVPVLVAGYTISRWLVVQAVVHYPYVRYKGLGSAFQGQQLSRESSSATVVGVVALVIPTAVTLLYRDRSQVTAAVTIISMCAALTVTAIVGHRLASRIARNLGGLTGDVYGALAEVGTSSFLLMFVMSVRVAGMWL